MKFIDHKNNDRKWIVGIGSALVDMLSHESDAFLEKTGAIKGGMTLVDDEFMASLSKMVTGTPSIVTGGSACNTIVGIARLGGKARFVGKCGNGEFGVFFHSDLKKQNVDPALLYSDSPTGRSLSIITPDAQRSMFTYLGAAAETKPEEITSQTFENAAVVHVEGYLISNHALILEALKKAKDSGAFVSLDLASYNVVEESKQELDILVDKYIDILIANEDEAYAFTGYKDEIKALEALSQRALLAVLKVGERGSYVCFKNQIVKTDAVKIEKVVDTTGAGDLWASGFLYGLMNQYSLEKSARLASACGAEVCNVIGANIPDSGWARIRKIMEE